MEITVHGALVNWTRSDENVRVCVDSEIGTYYLLEGK